MMQDTTNVLLVIGVVFHVIFAYTVIDMYFTSPIVHGVREVVSTLFALKILS
jgi:hypothetical protein